MAAVTSCENTLLATGTGIFNTNAHRKYISKKEKVIKSINQICRSDLRKKFLTWLPLLRTHHRTFEGEWKEWHVTFLLVSSEGTPYVMESLHSRATAY